MSRFYGASLGIPTEGGSVVTIADPPSGTFSDVVDAKFIHYNGYTYIGYVAEDTGNVEVISYHEATGVTSTPVVMRAAVGGANGNPDNHDAPAILVRDSDHKLIVAYSPHSQIPFYVRISTNSLTTDPTMSGGFGAESDVGTAAQATTQGDVDPVPEIGIAAQATQPGTKTYASLIELTGEAAIYLWWRRYNTAGQTRQGYVKSVDNGTTWGEYVNVWGSSATGLSNFNYRRLATNGVDRMDLYVTDTDRSLANPSSLYHIYYDGGNWKQSDGTDTGKIVGLFTSDATLIKNTTDGPVAPLSCGYDGTGKPVTLLLTFDTTEATIYQARFDGAAWDIVEIDATGGLLGGGPFGICAALDRDDVDTVWFPKVVSGKFEMFRFDSPDSGATWPDTQITSGSAFDNAGADSVWNHTADIKIAWSYGTLGSAYVFSAAIRGGY